MEALEELEESRTQTSEVPSIFLKITAATSTCITQETGKAANLQTTMEVWIEATTTTMSTRTTTKHFLAI